LSIQDLDHKLMHHLTRCINISLMLLLKMATDSAARVELGRSFYQQGTVKVKISESDSVPL